MGKIIKNGIDYSPTIHMPANTATQAGAVAAGGSNYNKVWGTDSQGNPGWIDYSSGSGGHTIKNDSGTSLEQKDNLQFKGIYTQNNGDNTEVDVVRQLTKAQIDALTGEAAKGFMEATDESSDLPLMANMVEYSTGISVKDKIEWHFLADDITSEGSGLDVSSYNDIYIIPKMQGWAMQNPIFTIKLLNTKTSFAVYASDNYGIGFAVNFSTSGVLTITDQTLRGWTSCTYTVYAR